MTKSLLRKSLSENLVAMETGVMDIKTYFLRLFSE
jgi:hypothetical protein